MGSRFLNGQSYIASILPTSWEARFPVVIADANIVSANPCTCAPWRGRGRSKNTPLSRDKGVDTRAGWAMWRNRWAFFNFALRAILPTLQNNIERKKKRDRRDPYIPGPPHRRCKSNHGQSIDSQDGALSILIAANDIVLLKQFGSLP